MKEITIPRAEELEALKKAISKDGREKFHVISDFDKTLTKAFVNGEEVPSIISVLRDGEYLTSDYAEKAHALYSRYHQIEANSAVLLKEKKKAMQEWWTEHFKLLIESRLNKRDLERVVKSGKVKLREGDLEFFDFLKEKKIPLVILSSSGLGVESISMYLENKKRMYDNVHIVSNSFKWDENGYAIGINKPIIHSMNKDEASVKDCPFFDKIKDRRNVLLLGDTIEDTGMVKGLGCDKIIKIGFFNYDRENLAEYKKNYDILVLNDGTMRHINWLLKEMFAKDLKN